MTYPVSNSDEFNANAYRDATGAHSGWLDEIPCEKEPMDDSIFVEMVREMRELQRTYRHSPDHPGFRKIAEAERKVDNVLRRLKWASETINPQTKGE